MLVRMQLVERPADLTWWMQTRAPRSSVTALMFVDIHRAFDP